MEAGDSTMNKDDNMVNKKYSHYIMIILVYDRHIIINLLPVIISV